MEFLLRTLRSPRFFRSLKPPNSSPFPRNPPSCSFSFLSALSLARGHDSRVFSPSPFFIFRRMSSDAVSIEISAVDDRIEIDHETESGNVAESIKQQNVSLKEKRRQNKKEAVKQSEKCDILPEKSMSAKSSSNSKSDEIEELKKQLSGMERLVRTMKTNAKSKRLETEKKDEVEKVLAKPSSLLSLFTKPPNPGKNSTVSKRKEYISSVKSISLEEEVSSPKELSPEMILFVNHLHEHGYLSEANFLREGRLDLDRLSNNYMQDFLKFAAERFGHDHQDIAKWLSGSDLKKVALVGCPSVEKRTIFAAKNLRTFFSIEEDTVCQPCKLKSSCKFMKERVDKKEKLDLANALRVLTVFASNSVPQQLVLSNEIEVSINTLLKEVVNLSK